MSFAGAAPAPLETGARLEIESEPSIQSMNVEAHFTRAVSVAEAIERLLEAATSSVNAALYRLSNPRLVRALEQAAQREIAIRLVLDRGKYQESRTAQELLSNTRVRFRLLDGRQGRGSKMHHKFAILDDRVVITGSYNWTLESEEQNYENLLILREPELLEGYRREFEALWSDAADD